MNKILISIKPQWCQKIFNGEKTIEVRRTRPKLEPPFEVFVYQTKIRFKVRAWQENFQSMVFTPNGGAENGNGKVIGSFVCDKVYKIVPDGEYYSNGYDIDDDMLSETCLGRGYLTGYGLGYTLYGWHITAPTLFDKPKELSEFCVPCKEYDSDKPHCGECAYYSYSPNDCGDAQEECLCGGSKPLRRPPQSWCRVEDKVEKALQVCEH